MWKDLTQDQKAEVMDLYLSKGITSLSQIRDFYDSALQGNRFDDGGNTKQEEIPPITPFRQKTEVIITPDLEYNQYLNTLPDNQRFTPNDKYDSYLYWKLNGKPRNFEEAYKRGMFAFDSSDNSYHANSIAFGDDGIGYFMKPKDHSTVHMETDWYNKGIVTEEGGNRRYVTPEEKLELDSFRRNYELTDDPNRPNYFMYRPRNFSDGGKIYIKPENREHPDGGRIYIGGADQEVVVTPEQTFMQSIANRDPYVDYQFYSPTGNSIVQTINSTPRWQQYWADQEGSRVSNAMHQASPKVLDLLTAVDAVATGPEAIEGLYGLYNLAKSGVRKGARRIATAAKTAPEITAKNAANITPKQWTAAQDAAIARGDMAEAQRLSDLHAYVKEYNSNFPLYHGSSEKNITSFNPNASSNTLVGSGGTTFFTPNFEAADIYAKARGMLEMTDEPGRVYKVYSAHKNPKIIDYDGASYLGTGTKLTINSGDGTARSILNPKGGKHFLNEIEAFSYDKLPVEGLEYPKYYAYPRNSHVTLENERIADITSKEAAKAISEGYDAAILKNVNEGIGSEYGQIGPIDDYAIRDTRLIKSADAVTYDDNGIRIPLGLRHNPKLNDIRYGLIPLGLGLGATTISKR